MKRDYELIGIGRWPKPKTRKNGNQVAWGCPKCGRQFRGAAIMKHRRDGCGKVLASGVEPAHD